MNRVVFLVDGFNLYHSIRDLLRKTGRNAKWLDVNRLCQSYIPLFGKDAIFGEIFYFSAIRYYMQTTDPGIISRHITYLKCLEDTGIHTILGRFKAKDVFCHNCSNSIKKHEEKETDVSIAVKILEIAFYNSAETIVILTGDTDLAPAVKAALAHSKTLRIGFAFPYNRKNKELERLSNVPSFVINQAQYFNHQFPDPVTLSSGVELIKPAEWA